MRFVPSLLIAASVGAIAGAEAAPAPPVIGGRSVEAGQWRDVAAVLYDGRQGCSGVLIAPTVVMTAAHCLGQRPDAVLLGTRSLSHPSAGERVAVVDQLLYPDDHYDVALLLLEHASSLAPRKLATGWARGQIVDGARVALVGYGAVDRDGAEFVDELQVAETTITDAGCARHDGCDPVAAPDGELGAGGAGIDTCPGDSGGPLYLLTDAGPLLAGITSRGYRSNQFSCSEGGIYVRPDKDEVVTWIESAAQVVLVDGRAPIGPDLDLEPGATQVERLEANDPRAGAAHLWTIATPPATGTASIDADGLLTVTAPEELGETFVIVRATDAADPTRSAKVRLAIRTVVDDDAGCCQTGGTTTPGSGLGLAAGIAGWLGRGRRRCA